MSGKLSFRTPPQKKTQVTPLVFTTNLALPNVHLFMHVNVHVDVYDCISICIYVNVCVSVSVFVHVYGYRYMDIGICIYVYEYVCVYMYMYITLIKLEERLLLGVSRVYNTIIRQLTVRFYYSFT